MSGYDRTPNPWRASRSPSGRTPAPQCDACDLDEHPLDFCFPCHGSGVLPGWNFVAQGSVNPNCWHCNGQGRTSRSELPAWSARVIGRVSGSPTPTEQ